MVEQEGVVVARVAEHQAVVAVALAAADSVGEAGVVKDLEPEEEEVEVERQGWAVVLAGAVAEHLEWVVVLAGVEEEIMALGVITDLEGGVEVTTGLVETTGLVVTTGRAATTDRAETMGLVAMEEVSVVQGGECKEAEPGLSLRKQDLGPLRISNPWELMKLNPVSFRSTGFLS